MEYTPAQLRKINALALLAYLGSPEAGYTGERTNATGSGYDEDSGLHPSAVLRGWAHTRWARPLALVPIWTDTPNLRPRVVFPAILT